MPGMDSTIKNLGYYDLPNGEQGAVSRVIAKWMAHNAPYDLTYTFNMLSIRTRGDANLMPNVTLMPLPRDLQGQRVSDVSVRNLRGHFLSPDSLVGITSVFRHDSVEDALAELRAAHKQDVEQWKGMLTDAMKAATNPQDFASALSPYNYEPRVGTLLTTLNENNALHSATGSDHYLSKMRKALVSGNIPQTLEDQMAAFCPPDLKSHWHALVDTARTAYNKAQEEAGVNANASAPRIKASSPVEKRIIQEKETKEARKEFWTRADGIAETLQVSINEMLQKIDGFNPTISALRFKAAGASGWQRPEWIDTATLDKVMQGLVEASSQRNPQLWNAPVMLPGEKSPVFGYDKALRQMYAKGSALDTPQELWKSGVISRAA